MEQSDWIEARTNQELQSTREKACTAALQSQSLHANSSNLVRREGKKMEREHQTHHTMLKRARPHDSERPPTVTHNVKENSKKIS